MGRTHRRLPPHVAALVPLAACAACASVRVEEATVDQLHEHFRRGDLTSRELVEVYRARIEAYDGPKDLKAFVVLNPQALAEAEALDAEFRDTGELRPLHGIPVVIKDNCDTEGLQTTGGSAALAGSTPPDDCFLVQRIRAAGGIVLGKSNMDEWAFSPYKTESSILGTTRNPYDLERVPAGSSGGTAAAVAANLGAIGIGTDTGNSIRGPSSHCALVGIRPTLGLTSRDGIIPLSLTADVAGPMCRTVADAALLLGVVAGYDPADPATELIRDYAIPDYTQHLDPDGLRGARIGVLRAYFATETTDPQIVALMEAAMADLERLGATVIDDFEAPETPPPNWGRDGGGRRRGGGFRANIDHYLASLGPGAPVKTLKEIVEAGAYHPGLERILPRTVEGPEPDLSEVALAGIEGDPARVAMREALIAALDAQQLDAIIYPTWSNAPRVIGDLESPHGDNSQVLAPRTGLPALSVPMGVTYGHLPAGLTILGRPLSEARLIELAYAYEQGTAHRRAPPGFGPLE